MRTLICFGLLVGAISARAQAPLCVIGQPAAVNGSPMIDLVNPLANELDAVAQLHPVTYAIDDPILRQAFLDGKVKKPEAFYKLGDVFAAAKALNAEYAIWVEAENLPIAVKVNKSVKGATGNSQKVLNCHLVLYKRERKIWEETENLAVSISSERSADETIRSIMSSLNSKMQTGPLKGMPKYPRGAVPNQGEVGKGQAPIIPESSDDDPTLNDWTAIQGSVKDLVSQGKMAAAEMLLRDAVDAAPNDAARRIALIEFLRKDASRVDSAVEATIAAAEALGDPTLISKAARILLDNNRIDRANEIVKDAIASDPNNPDVQLLQGELQMRSALPDQALKHLENALKVKPTAEGFLLRAVCRALLGAEDGVKLDLERATKEDPQILHVQYARVAAILDSAWEVAGPDMRALLQKAELKPSSDEVTDGVDAQDRMAKACLALLGENVPNAQYEKSHGIRLLALNLLVQTVAELRHFVTKGDKQSLTDARNDLGETLKTFADAKEAIKKEGTDARNIDSPRRL